MTTKYGVFTTTDLLQLHVVKATTSTPVDADWDSQDSSNSPIYTFGSSFEILSYWSFEFGTDICIASQQRSGRVSYHQYDTIRNIWSVVDETVTVVGGAGFENAPATHAVSISVDSTGIIVVVAAYNDGTNERLRLFSKTPGGENWSWGEGDGQLGLNDAVDYSSPVQVGASVEWVKTAAGEDHTIVIKNDKTLWAYGINASGQLGDNSSVTRSSPVQIGSETDWKQHSVGNNHSAAIREDGSLWTWGESNNGQLGDNQTSVDRSSPTQVGSLTDWRFVSADGLTCHAIKEDGTLWGWGDNSPNGQLGDGTTVSKSSPVQIGSDTDWVQVVGAVSTGSHTLALRRDNTLWSWGDSNSGDCGHNDTVARSSPVQVGSDTDWVSISAGTSHSAARKSDGTIWTWGFGSNGELGLGTTNNRSSPVQVGSETDWIQLEVGSAHSMATRGDGALWAWGAGGNGKLGDSQTSQRNSPVQIGSDTDWGKISLGLQHSTVIKSLNGWVNKGEASGGTAAIDYTGVTIIPPASDDRINWTYKDDTNSQVKTRNFKTNIASPLLFGWGLNTKGELGDNTVINKSSPVQLGEQGIWDSIGPGTQHNIGIRTDGTLWGWGENEFGSLGDSSVTLKSSPTQIGALTTWAVCNAGTDFSMAIKTDGTLWTWGTGETGRTAQNDTVDRSSPVQVGALTDWATISGGSFGSTHALSTKTDGTMWAWGQNGKRLGDNTIINRSSPVQIGALTTWSQAEASDDHSAAIKTDGSIWTWGDSGFGQLGHNNSTPDLSSPAQVGSLTDWAIVSLGRDCTIAVKKDGTLWAWGENGTGRLGDGTTIDRSSPVQIGALTDWADIWTGVDGGIALKTDGSIWTWGDNGNGGLGDGTTIDRSSPVQVGNSFEWDRVYSYFQGSMALKLNTFSDEVTIDATVDTATIVTAPGVIDSAGKIYAGYIGVDNQMSIASWTSASAPTFPVAATADTLYAWGNGLNGRLGLGDIANRSSPVQIGALTDWAHVGTGNAHTHAVKKDGTLWAMGDSDNGGLGDNQSATDFSSPIQIGALTDWLIVEAGNDWSIAIKTDGTLWAWGQNSAGQLGQDDVISRSSPVQIGALTTWSKVEVAEPGTNWLALTTDGTMFSCGQASTGGLGLNDLVSRSSPTQIGALTTWSKIAMGAGHGFAVKNDGTLWTWGSGATGRTAQNDTVDRSSPTQVGSLSDWDIPVVTSQGGKAIKTDKTLWTWGTFAEGIIGDDTGISKSSPVQIGSDTNWIAVDGDDHALALRDDGTLWVWGDAIQGKLGNNQASTDESSPVQIGSDTDWNFIKAGANQSYAIRQIVTDITGVDEDATSRTVFGHGRTVSPFVAACLALEPVDDVHLVFYDDTERDIYHEDDIDGEVNSDTLIEDIGPPKVWESANAGDDHTGAIRTDGTLWHWGGNHIGQLGINDIVDRSSPVQVGSLTTWAQISVGDNHSLAIKDDGTLWSWGQGQSGRTGHNDQVNRSSPVQIGSDTDWAQINAGNVNSFAIKDNGTMWSWGLNNFGFLGHNDVVNRSSPTQVGALTTWEFISARSSHALALKTDGSIWTWGSDSRGRLGLGTVDIDRSSPTQIGTLTDWESVSAGKQFSTAIKTNGTLWSWGKFTDGRLGQNDAIDKSSPVQVGALTDWAKVSGLGRHCLAIKDDGTLWAWGDTHVNEGSNPAYGQVGDGTTIDRSSPVQIGTLTNWNVIGGGEEHSLAIESSNSLYTWGSDELGQLGHSDKINRSSPVQVGESSNLNISANVIS